MYYAEGQISSQVLKVLGVRLVANGLMAQSPSNPTTKRASGPVEASKRGLGQLPIILFLRRNRLRTCPNS